MKKDAHKSFSSLNLKRIRAETALLKKADAHYRNAVKLEKAGKPLQARAEAAKGRALAKRVSDAGQYTDGPVGRLPNIMTLTWLQEQAVNALLAIREPGKRASGARLAQQKKAIYKRYAKGALKLGYTKEQIEMQWRDVKDIADLERRAENPQRKRNATVAGLKAELAQVDRDIAELETDPFYQETPGRKAYARKWLAHHRRQRRQIEALIKRRSNGVVEAAAGLQALEYFGGKVRGKKNPPKALSRLTKEGLQKALDRQRAHVSKLTDEMIRQGRGSEKFSDTVKKSDSLSMAYVAGTREVIALREELEKRMKYHGSAKPIKNPSITVLSKTFQGDADGSVQEEYAASAAPKNLARAGRLVFLKVAGKTYRIPGATVAIAPNNKLWIVGSRAPLFNTKAKPGEGLDVGEVSHICYETAKKHIGDGKRYEYVHEFGEEGGRRPHLIIDHEGMPILRGGDYTIKAEGIVN